MKAVDIGGKGIRGLSESKIGGVFILEKSKSP